MISSASFSRQGYVYKFAQLSKKKVKFVRSSFVLHEKSTYGILRLKGERWSKKKALPTFHALEICVYTHLSILKHASKTFKQRCIDHR